jgi:hypothetical protein
LPCCHMYKTKPFSFSIPKNSSNSLHVLSHSTTRSREASVGELHSRNLLESW